MDEMECQGQQDQQDPKDHRVLQDLQGVRENLEE
jgi:hypothetical protein